MEFLYMACFGRGDAVFTQVFKGLEFSQFLTFVNNFCSLTVFTDYVQMTHFKHFYRFNKNVPDLTKLTKIN